MKQQNDLKKGMLYIVATPIGNMEDITLRAIRILKEADMIAAEDTRHTKKLLNTYQIATSLVSLHEHNERAKTALIINKINEGKNVAYVTDAGTPCISDPGYFLISKAHDEDIRVIPVPGPSSVIAAVSAAGFPADSFIFCGFLPTRENKRRKFIETLKNEERTIIFYESPVRLLSTFKDLLDILGDRKMVLAREITKIFEEIKRGNISEFIEKKTGTKIKGEITVIIEGEKIMPAPVSQQEIAQKVIEAKKSRKLSLRDAINLVSSETGISRKKVYEIGIKTRKG